VVGPTGEQRLQQTGEGALADGDAEGTAARCANDRQQWTELRSATPCRSKKSHRTALLRSLNGSSSD
jgi:hypothetical protein